MIICMSFTANSTGGEYYHTLTNSEMPKHRHAIQSTSGELSISNKLYPFQIIQEEGQYMDTNACLSQGGNAAHNNIQPYVTTFFWKRTK